MNKMFSTEPSAVNQHLLQQNPPGALSSSLADSGTGVTSGKPDHSLTCTVLIYKCCQGLSRTKVHCFAYKVQVLIQSNAKVIPDW